MITPRSPSFTHSTVHPKLCETQVKWTRPYRRQHTRKYERIAATQVREGWWGPVLGRITFQVMMRWDATFLCSSTCVCRGGNGKVWIENRIPFTLLFYMSKLYWWRHTRAHLCVQALNIGHSLLTLSGCVVSSSYHHGCTYVLCTIINYL